MKTYRETDIYYPQLDAEHQAKNAKLVLGHYFATLAQDANLTWDWNNQAEVENAVDDIIDTVVERIVSGLR